MPLNSIPCLKILDGKSLIEGETKKPGTAQAVIRGGEKNPKRNLRYYPLKGLVCCGNCKRALTRRKLRNEGGYFYQCTYSTHDRDTECPVGERYSEAWIEDTAIVNNSMLNNVAQDNKLSSGANILEMVSMPDSNAIIYNLILTHDYDAALKFLADGTVPTDAEVNVKKDGGKDSRGKTIIKL